MQRAVKAAKAVNHNGHPLRSGVPVEASGNYAATLMTWADPLAFAQAIGPRWSCRGGRRGRSAARPRGWRRRAAAGAGPGGGCRGRADTAGASWTGVRISGPPKPSRAPPGPAATHSATYAAKSEESTGCMGRLVATARCGDRPGCPGSGRAASRTRSRARWTRAGRPGGRGPRRRPSPASRESARPARPRWTHRGSGWRRPGWPRRAAAACPARPRRAGCGRSRPAGPAALRGRRQRRGGHDGAGAGDRLGDALAAGQIPSDPLDGGILARGAGQDRTR